MYMILLQCYRLSLEYLYFECSFFSHRSKSHKTYHVFFLCVIYFTFIYNTKYRIDNDEHLFESATDIYTYNGAVITNLKLIAQNYK